MLKAPGPSLQRHVLCILQNGVENHSSALIEERQHSHAPGLSAICAQHKDHDVRVAGQLEQELHIKANSLKGLSEGCLWQIGHI